ncbi:MAG: aspartate dehydrogenase, partial [Geminicoccaceae bacterium]|nr:aspartate dehydrogenase [Geminicoccaceae bacterium]
MRPARPPLRVAIAGLGAIGRTVAERLDRGIEGLELVAVSARDRAAAEARLRATVSRPVPVLTVDRLAEIADVVVECAPATVFRAIAEPAVAHGRILLPLSVGALLDHLDLVERARATGARILPPTGALLGLDAVRAATEGTIRSVTMVTRKPPAGLAGAPYLVERGIELDALREPLRVFAGSAREGARGFPANVNVAAALALAGIGPDRTRLEIWADPTVTRNTHRIEVDAEEASFTMTIANVPSSDNPRTGRLTALSVVAALRRLTAPFVVG